MSRSNRPAAEPSRLYSRVPPSLSVAATGAPMSCMPVVFSGNLLVVLDPSRNLGAWLLSVVPLAGRDQPLSPSSFLASTWTL